MADARLIPAGIRDASNIALNELIDRMGTVDITPLLVYLIDNVSVSVLPHLAEQFSVTGYDGWVLMTTEAERRALIKTAIAKHYHKGTPYAIKRILADVGIVAEIPEWWQYEGLPFHFQAEIDTSGLEISAEKMNLIERLIGEYKNVRSVLDFIAFITSVTSSVPVYNTGAIAYENVTIYG